MPFAKGKSGNPGGRPRAAAGLRDYLRHRYGDNGQKLVTRLEALSKHKNPKISLDATELLVAYLVGRPVSQHEVAGEDGQPIGLRIMFGGRYRPEATL